MKQTDSFILETDRLKYHIRLGEKEDATGYLGNLGFVQALANYRESKYKSSQSEYCVEELMPFNTLKDAVYELEKCFFIDMHGFGTSARNMVCYILAYDFEQDYPEQEGIATPSFNPQRKSIKKDCGNSIAKFESGPFNNKNFSIEKREDNNHNTYYRARRINGYQSPLDEWQKKFVAVAVSKNINVNQYGIYLLCKCLDTNNKDTILNDPDFNALIDLYDEKHIGNNKFVYLIEEAQNGVLSGSLKMEQAINGHGEHPGMEINCVQYEFDTRYFKFFALVNEIHKFPSEFEAHRNYLSHEAYKYEHDNVKWHYTVLYYMLRIYFKRVHIHIPEVKNELNRVKYSSKKDVSERNRENYQFLSEHCLIGDYAAWNNIDIKIRRNAIVSGMLKLQELSDKRTYYINTSKTSCKKSDACIFNILSDSDETRLSYAIDLAGTKRWLIKNNSLIFADGINVKRVYGIPGIPIGTAEDIDEVISSFPSDEKRMIKKLLFNEIIETVLDFHNMFGYKKGYLRNIEPKSFLLCINEEKELKLVYWNPETVSAEDMDGKTVYFAGFGRTEYGDGTFSSRKPFTAPNIKAVLNEFDAGTDKDDTLQNYLSKYNISVNDFWINGDMYSLAMMGIYIIWGKEKVLEIYNSENALKNDILQMESKFDINHIADINYEGLSILNDSDKDKINLALREIVHKAIRKSLIEKYIGKFPDDFKLFEDRIIDGLSIGFDYYDIPQKRSITDNKITVNCGGRKTETVK